MQPRIGVDKSALCLLIVKFENRVNRLLNDENLEDDFFFQVPNYVKSKFSYFIEFYLVLPSMRENFKFL